MPSLPKPRLRRSARARADGASVQAAAEPNVEVVEFGDLRWVNIERPTSVDRAWLEEHEERAESLMYIVYAVAALAAAAIFAPRKWPRSAMPLAMPVVPATKG